MSTADANNAATGGLTLAALPSSPLSCLTAGAAGEGASFAAGADLAAFAVAAWVSFSRSAIDDSGFTVVAASSSSASRCVNAPPRN